VSIPLYAFLASFAATALAVRAVLGFLRRRSILDHPNERSSHSRPTPRGGGLAVTPVILVGWFLLGGAGFLLSGQGVVMAGAAALLVLSWRDDRVSLPARLRILVHLAAVLAGLYALPAKQMIFQGWLPFWADRAAAAILWLWFLNLYNFMDGIDGITGIETLCIAGGLWLLSPAQAQAGVLAGASVGFLMWNWHPAKIFLGDSGSVPLGYLLGWLLLRMAGDGLWAPALILPAYYLADATITISKRALRREKIWQAHRQHFYQRAVQAGSSHARVSVMILLADIALVEAAQLAEIDPGQGLATAAVATAAILYFLYRLSLRQRA
jgi:UDP-N-acetylmuramyl pentapeptide phosphotransferase/UDP-N-acetylglucosamine-1-phosphate transferase